MILFFLLFWGMHDHRIFNSSNHKITTYKPGYCEDIDIDLIWSNVVHCFLGCVICLSILLKPDHTIPYEITVCLKEYFHSWSSVLHSLSLKTGTHVCPPKCVLYSIKSVSSILWENNLLFVENTSSFLLGPK